MRRALCTFSGNPAAVKTSTSFATGVLGAETPMGSLLCEKLLRKGQSVVAVVDHIDDARKVDKLFQLQLMAGEIDPSTKFNIFELCPLHDMSFKFPLSTCDRVVCPSLSMENHFRTISSSVHLEKKLTAAWNNLFSSVNLSTKIIICHTVAFPSGFEANATSQFLNDRNLCQLILGSAQNCAFTELYAAFAIERCVGLRCTPFNQEEVFLLEKWYDESLNRGLDGRLKTEEVSHDLAEACLSFSESA